MPGHLTRRFDHLAHRVSVSAPKVVDQAIAFLQSIQCKEMCRGQIRDVDVIANASAVWRWIICAIDLCRVALAQRHTQNKRDEMRLGLMRLPAAVQRTTGIEVTKRCKMQAVNLTIALKHLLNYEFGMTVHIRWTEQRFFGQRFLTGLIDCGGG